METKFKKKFISICMAAVLIVFSIIVAIVHGINDRNVEKDAIDILEALAIKENIVEKTEDNIEYHNIEIPYEIRYLIVAINENKDAVIIKRQNMKTAIENKIIEHSLKIFNENDDYGRYDNLRFIVKEKDGYKTFIYIDYIKELYLSTKLVRSVYIVAISSFLAIFVLVWIFSNKAIKPFVDNYEKQTKFIADASHELKTPLTIINAYNDLIEMEYGSNENSEIIKKQIKIMDTMIKNLSLLAKIDGYQIKEECEQFNISDVAIDISESFKPIIETNNKTFKVDVKEKVKFFGSERLIRRLIYLLLENSVKYSLSKVCFSLSKSHNKIIIQISNDADGIDIGNLNHYCDRFFRTSASRASSIEGSGIGLSIAKEIVVFHKGDIKLFSDDGKNFNVTIIL